MSDQVSSTTPGDAPEDEQYQALTPMLIVRGGVKAIEFYTRVFGATELNRMEGPGGTIAHAELLIIDSWMMLADEDPAFGALSPLSIGGSPVILHLYVKDVDHVIANAEAAGASVLRPAEDKFYGDRSGMILDPFGHRWMLASRKEDLSYDEANARYQATRKAVES